MSAFGSNATTEGTNLVFDFAQPRSRRSDPSTSRAAAQRMKAAAPSLEKQILDALAFRALTDDAICLSLGVDPRRWPSVKTCRSRMKNAGKVVWTGEVRDGQRLWTLPQNVSPLRLVPNADYL